MRDDLSNDILRLSAQHIVLVLIAMAVQEPTLTYTNPATGRTFTKNELQSFGGEYLGAHLIFWSASSPWLRTK